METSPGRGFPSTVSSPASHQGHNPTKSSSSPLAQSSVARFWRPAAQRNLRNQWSKLASLRPQWASASSSGKSHASSLANAFLSHKYVSSMELGVLTDVPDIRKKARSKLLKQQELYRSKLLSSYKDLVGVVTQMVNTSRCMRCYLKTAGSPLMQFASISEDINDTGDGGGIPVFAFWSISHHEQLAEELIQMFICELNLKRLLVGKLLAIGCVVPQVNEMCWSNELYPGEFSDLIVCNLFSKETSEVDPPRLIGWKHDMPAVQFKSQPSSETLQVYLTSWLAEVNVDTHRVDEIFAVIGEEMHVSLL